MAEKMEKGLSEPSVAIHQYYMDILNCMPNVVYWVDLDCNLKGANSQFVELLGLHDLQDLKGTPYFLLEKYAYWSSSRVESFKLDDMAAIFSGKARYKVSESPVPIIKNGEVVRTEYYVSTRAPLFDKKREVIGLVVVLEEVDAIRLTSQDTDVLSAHVSQHKRDDIVRSPRILMVEDNEIAQKVEQALLMSLNCVVDIVSSGELAEKAFEPGKYDVIFMDIGLQDTSGYIVAKKLREKEKDSAYHVPIIALTSYDASVVQYDCRDYFMDGVISKPLSKEQAEQIIQRYFYQQNVEVIGLHTI